MRLRLMAAMVLVGASLAHASLDDPLVSTSRGVGGSDSMALQQYSLGVGKELIKEYLNLDVDAWALSWERRGEALARDVLYVPAGTTLGQEPSQMPGGAVAGSAMSAQTPHPRGLDLRLDLTGDILRIKDPRDLPVALRVSSRRRWMGMPLETRLSIPFSWKESVEAGARVPLPQLNALPWERFLESFGLQPTWDLSSGYSNRLGVNQFETGLGTRWMENWRFDYDYRTRSGQGDFEASHWLKLGREF